MVRTPDDSRTNSFCHPDAIDKVADTGLNPHKITSADAKTRGITCVQPNRIFMRDLVQPLCIPGAAVNERREAEGREEKHLSFIYVDVVPVHVALDVCGNGALRPAPVFQCFGVKLQLA